MTNFRAVDMLPAETKGHKQWLHTGRPPNGGCCFSFMTLRKLCPHPRAWGKSGHSGEQVHRAHLFILTPLPRRELELVENPLILGFLGSSSSL